jgi:hypothetical protein
VFQKASLPPVEKVDLSLIDTRFRQVTEPLVETSAKKLLPSVIVKSQKATLARLAPKSGGLSEFIIAIKIGYEGTSNIWHRVCKY